MFARQRASQRDGCHRQDDDDFGGWVKNAVLFSAVSGPKFMKLWYDVSDPKFLGANTQKISAWCSVAD